MNNKSLANCSLLPVRKQFVELYFAAVAYKMVTKTIFHHWKQLGRFSLPALHRHFYEISHFQFFSLPVISTIDVHFACVSLHFRASCPWQVKNIGSLGFQCFAFTFTGAFYAIVITYHHNWLPLRRCRTFHGSASNNNTVFGLQS